MHRRKAGFTVFELMIVCGIIGLLAVIAIYSIIHVRDVTHRTVCLRNLKDMAGAKEMAALDLRWPADAGPGTIGNPYYKDTISTYLSPGVRPVCPTGAECWYQSLLENPVCTSGITGHTYLAVSP